MSNFIATLLMGEIAKFCQRWKIQELALFGSALRDDFGPDSDLDTLVTFAEGAEWGLLDHVEMQYELQILLHRGVDLISKRAIERSQNWLRRGDIKHRASPILHTRGRTCDRMKLLCLILPRSPV